MRVSTILVTACLALFASAESTSAHAVASTTDAAAAAANSAQATITKCLDACKPGDVDCASRCVTVPNPNAAQVSDPPSCPVSHHHHHLHVPTLYPNPPTSPNQTQNETNPHLPLQVNATNACVSACPQGKGSAADTQAYSTCVQGCIGANYYSPQSGTPQPTNAAGSGSSGSSGSNSAGSGGSGSSASGTAAGGNGDSKATGTATGTAAKSTSSGNAAAAAGVGGGVVGVVGFLAAVMAL